MTERPPHPHQGRVIHKEITIDADAKRVYEAWADPKKISSWFVDRAEGDMRTDDVVTWIFEQFGMSLPVTVYAREEDEYLAFGGELLGRPPSLQEVILESDGGRTTLRLANSGFSDDDEGTETMAGTDSGWSMALAMLKLQIERHAAGHRRHVLVMQPAKVEFADLATRFFTTDGLATWIGRSASLGSDPLEVGAAVTIETIDGPVIEGSILAKTGWELLVDWPAQNGAISFKGFNAGPGTRMVGATFDAWDLDEAAFGEVEAMLRSAIGRLAESLGA